MCVKAVDACPFEFDSIPNQWKTQEICDRDFFDDLFTLKN